MGKPTLDSAWRGVRSQLPTNWGLALTATSTGVRVQLIEQIDGKPFIRFSRAHTDPINLLLSAGHWIAGLEEVDDEPARTAARPARAEG